MHVIEFPVSERLVAPLKAFPSSRVREHPSFSAKNICRHHDEPPNLLGLSLSGREAPEHPLDSAIRSSMQFGTRFPLVEASRGAD